VCVLLCHPVQIFVYILSSPRFLVCFFLVHKKQSGKLVLWLLAAKWNKWRCSLIILHAYLPAACLSAP